MSDIKFLDKDQCNRLIGSITNIKHKVIVLLMLDCGLRVSEVISLKYKDFDFKKDIVVVESLKKRNKSLKRQIPLSKRLYQELATYLGKQSNIDGDNYLFKSPSKDGHITRFAVNKFLTKYNKKLNFTFINPHSLRHSFGTNHISNGTPLENIKTMLGHTKYDTTLIYAQIPTEILRQNINSVNKEKVSFLMRFLKTLNIYSKKEQRISINYHKDNFTIGRQKEQLKLQENAEKGINTILIGDIGLGKSHLLENIKTEKKVLKIDDLTGLKQTLGSLLLYLYDNDKKHCKELVYGDLDLTKVKVKINRLSVRNLAQEICKIVTPKEYILCIDRVDNITPKSIQFLEEIKDSFVIFCSSRSVKIDRSSFMWNFDRLDIKPFDRVKSMELINKLSYDLETEDKQLFRNHIYEQSNGNPRVIYEIIDRYRKEPIITNEVIRTVRHTASLKEFDLTFVIFLGFGLMYLLRYMSKEVDNESFRFIGGVALVLTLISRQLLGFTKRKFM